jgi:hypothetical protein
MSKLNPATCPAAQFATPDFLARVALVETEVQRRKAATTNPNAGAYVMNLWLKWIEKNGFSESARSTAA